MAGTWTTTSPPTRPGAYFNFVRAAEAALAGGVTGTTAVIGTSDWGPDTQVVSVQSQAGYEGFFGTNEAGTLRTNVLGALDGLGGNGANIVLAYRLVGTAGAKAAVTLAGADLAAALTVTARYKGARANNWTVEVRTNAVDTSLKDLVLYESGSILEVHTVTGGNNDTFATEINASGSPYIQAAVVGATGRVVTNVAATAMTGGNSGTTVSATDLSNAYTTLAGQDFNSMAIGDITDATMELQFVNSIKDLNRDGRRVIGVIGGAVTDGYSAAVARSDLYNSADIVNVGATALRRLSDDVQFHGAQLAPRIAGSLAGIGLTRSLTNVKFTGYQVVAPLTRAQYEQASTEGVLVFVNDTPGRVRVEQGVTSLQTTTDEAPEEFKSIRNVSISHFIQTQLNAVAMNNYVGIVPNTETARRDLVATFLQFLRTLENSGVIQPGSVVELDDRFVQAGNAVYVRFGVTYADSIERIFVTVKLG